jgi:hypothetical protein
LHYEDETCEAIAEKIGFVEHQVTCYGNLGALAVDCNRPTEARFWYEHQLALTQEVERQDLLASTQYELAQVLEAEGRYAEALDLAQAAGFEVSDRSLCIQIPETAQQEALNLLLGSNQDDNCQFPPYLLLNPWTSCQSRNYDSQRFAIATRQLAEATQMPVVVTGIEKDRDKSC